MTVQPPVGVRHEIDPHERSSDHMRRDQSELARLPRNVRNRTANRAERDVGPPFAVRGHPEDRSDDPVRGDENAEVVPLRLHGVLHEHALLFEPGRLGQR